MTSFFQYLHHFLQSSKQSSSPWSLTHILLWEPSLGEPQTRNTLAQFGAILELMFAFGLPMHKHKFWMMVAKRKSYKNRYKYLIINIHFPVVAGKHLGHPETLLEGAEGNIGTHWQCTLLNNTLRKCNENLLRRPNKVQSLVPWFNLMRPSTTVPPTTNQPNKVYKPVVLTIMWSSVKFSLSYPCWPTVTIR